MDVMCQFNKSQGDFYMGNSRRKAREYEHNLLITYDREKKIYQYPETAEEFLSAQFDGRSLFDIFREDRVASEEGIGMLEEHLNSVLEAEYPKVRFMESYLRSADNTFRWYCVGFVPSASGKYVNITFTDIADELAEIEMSGRDPLTGLLQHRIQDLPGYLLLLQYLLPQLLLRHQLIQHLHPCLHSRQRERG